VKRKGLRLVTKWYTGHIFHSKLEAALQMECCGEEALLFVFSIGGLKENARSFLLSMTAFFLKKSY